MYTDCLKILKQQEQLSVKATDTPCTCVNTDDTAVITTSHQPSDTTNTVTTAASNKNGMYIHTCTVGIVCMLLPSYVQFI